ncbi:MAG: YtxH domain-containing protein [bacterium]|jgi:gas vesicle protein
MSHHRSSANRIIWLLIGAAVGAGVALLYAPKKGKDTRRFIRKKAGDAREAISEAGESVREVYETVSGAGREAYDSVLDAGRQVYKKTAEVASEAADAIERGRKFVMR